MLKCYAEVNRRMCKDEYTYSQILTVGGLGTAAGTLYILESPFAGEEYEYAIMGVSTGAAAGTYQALVSCDQPPPVLMYDGSVSFGSASSAPYTFLKAQSFISSSLTSIPPSDTWVRVSNGNKYVYVRAITPASASVFVAIQFRFLPVKVIPARAHTVPDGMEEQYNIARADKVIERLEMDIEKGDRGGVSYGRLN